jgi:hypothetical protein
LVSTMCRLVSTMSVHDGVSEPTCARMRAYMNSGNRKQHKADSVSMMKVHYGRHMLMCARVWAYNKSAQWRTCAKLQPNATRTLNMLFLLQEARA